VYKNDTALVVGEGGFAFLHESGHSFFAIILARTKENKEMNDMISALDSNLSLLCSGALISWECKTVFPLYSG